MHDVEIIMTEPNRGTCKIDGKEIQITRFDVHGGADELLEVVVTFNAKSLNKPGVKAPTPEEIRALFGV